MIPEARPFILITLSMVFTTVTASSFRFEEHASVMSISMGCHTNDPTFAPLSDTETGPDTWENLSTSLL